MAFNHPSRTAYAAVSLALVLTGCSGSEEEETETPAPAESPTPIPTPTPTPAPGTVYYTLPFEVKTDDQAFSCDQTLTDLGVNNDTFTPTDLRFYISNLQLIQADGTVVTAELSQDGLWQYQDVSLLDFEDDTGNCTNGTTETNHQISFSVPEGDYVGLQFEVGVPEELNHIDADTAASPLNLSSMYWGWTNGYKFMRLEGLTDNGNSKYFLHVGSTDCSTRPSGAISCDRANRVSVALSGYEPESSRVLLDLRALFEGSALVADGSCMSEYDGDGCKAVFPQLGLPHQSNPDGGTQKVFSLLP